MATIKAYSDLEQSKKLAEILPLESADCFWDYDELQKYHRIIWFEDGYEKDSQLRLSENNVCAWSLAALLGVLPYPILYQQGDGAWGLDAWVEQVKPYSVKNATCEVDACVEMIIKLRELNML